MVKTYLLILVFALVAFQSANADLLPLLGLGGDTTTSKSPSPTHTAKPKKKDTTHNNGGLLGLSLPPLLGGASSPSASDLLSGILPTFSSSLNTAFPTGTQSGSASSSSSSMSMLSSASASMPTLSSMTSTSMAPPPPASTPVVVLTSTIPPPSATAASAGQQLIPVPFVCLTTAALMVVMATVY